MQVGVSKSNDSYGQWVVIFQSHVFAVLVFGSVVVVCKFVPSFKMSLECVDSSEEEAVVWNKDGLGTGLRTIHNDDCQPSAHSQPDSSSFLAPFGLAKPVDTGPCADDFDFDSQGTMSLDGSLRCPAPAPEFPPRAEDSQPAHRGKDSEPEHPGEVAQPAHRGEDSGDVAQPEQPGEVLQPEDPEDGSTAAKRRKLLEDPKFKKGTRLGDLTPESQKTLHEVRRLRKIQNSDRWHANWDAKGVPKGAAEVHGEVVGDVPQEPAEGGDAPQEPEVCEEPQEPSASKRLTLNDVRVL